ncbi:helix-turn-helix domain-containing protein [Actinomadura sp. 9N215]|uniref:helix-turn-helix domain-containing protein n=1 Tax=Actinomadura sp. 9N215 TaxID=3375150 RepID=UPI0037B47512
MRVASNLDLRAGDVDRLTKWAAADDALAKRARIILLAANGLPNKEIAERTGVTQPTVRHWRRRYETAGLAGLADTPRSGRPLSVDEIQVLLSTLAAADAAPVTARSIAADLGYCPTTVRNVWRRWELRPHDGRASRLVVAGLCLGLPVAMIVLAVDPPARTDVWPYDPMHAIPAVRRAVDGGWWPGPVLSFLTNVVCTQSGLRLHAVWNGDPGWHTPELRNWLSGPEGDAVVPHPALAAYSCLDLVRAFSSFIDAHPERLAGPVDAPIHTMHGFIAKPERVPGSITWIGIEPASRMRGAD